MGDTRAHRPGAGGRPPAERGGDDAAWAPGGAGGSPQERWRAMGEERAQLAGDLKRRFVQRKATSSAPAPSGAPVLGAQRGGGAPVDAGVRRRVEAATGAGLGDVRVHTGAASARSADAINAQAYTVGRDVHFAAGQYRPGSAEGERLIAHELVHTIQQGSSGGAPQAKHRVSHPGDAAEREADAVADAALRGERASPVERTGDVSRFGPGDVPDVALTPPGDLHAPRAPGIRIFPQRRGTLPRTSVPLHVRRRGGAGARHRAHGAPDAGAHPRGRDATGAGAADGARATHGSSTTATEASASGSGATGTGPSRASATGAAPSTTAGGAAPSTTGATGASPSRAGATGAAPSTSGGGAAPPTTGAAPSTAGGGAPRESGATHGSEADAEHPHLQAGVELSGGGEATTPIGPRRHDPDAEPPDHRVHPTYQVSMFAEWTDACVQGGTLRLLCNPHLEFSISGTEGDEHLEVDIGLSMQAVTAVLVPRLLELQLEAGAHAGETGGAATAGVEGRVGVELTPADHVSVSVSGGGGLNYTDGEGGEAAVDFQLSFQVDTN